MTGRRAGQRDERGAASVLVVAMLGLLMLVGSALGVAAAMVAAHRRAQSAADLVALAGAQSLAAAGDPCGAAARTATDNRARLVSCAVSGRDVVVTVTVDGPHWLAQTHDLGAAARAGPVR